jgi:hypothetical protein
VLTFVVGDRRFEASAGELVWLPRQVPHTFANLGDEPVWAFGVTTPAGLEGMFEEQGEYFATRHGPPDPVRIGEISDRYGVRALGPPLQPSSEHLRPTHRIRPRHCPAVTGVPGPKAQASSCARR